MNVTMVCLSRQCSCIKHCIKNCTKAIFVTQKKTKSLKFRSLNAFVDFMCFAKPNQRIFCCCSCLSITYLLYAMICFLFVHYNGRPLYLTITTKCLTKCLTKYRRKQIKCIYFITSSSVYLLCIEQMAEKQPNLSHMIMKSAIQEIFIYCISKQQHNSK